MLGQATASILETRSLRELRQPWLFLTLIPKRAGSYHKLRASPFMGSLPKLRTRKSNTRCD